MSERVRSGQIEKSARAIRTRDCLRQIIGQLIQRPSQGFHFAGIECVTINAAPRVKVRWTIRSDPLGYFLDELSPSLEFQRRPRFRRLQFVAGLARRAP